jgi:sugar/nucleoside kinase (ribokinase family)
MEFTELNHRKIEAVVAGHICMDIIPTFYASSVKKEGKKAGLEELLTPGKLVDIGPATISTGGAVSNTGLALHHLGVPVRLVGKVGPDEFGQIVLQLIAKIDPDLTEGMVVAEGEDSSYTLVISPPGIDRILLHCPGANHTFSDTDIHPEHLAEARLFHLGYPPLMRQFYSNRGIKLERLLRKVKEAGLVTSLDMSRPDPDSESGQVDWPALLACVLPQVDLFQPSLDEILFMLDRKTFDQMQAATPEGKSWLEGVDAGLLSNLAGELIEMGTPIVVFKLGDQGLYVRTSSDSARIGRICRQMGSNLTDWLWRECLVPCFKVQVVGTNGAGDCTIAGFLGGLLKGLSLEAVMTGAVATGACNVEAADATSGIPHWKTIQERIQAGWDQRPVKLNLAGWQEDPASRIWYGPKDHRM